MTRARETKITLPCSQIQKTELEQRAKEQQLSVSNYLRSLLGWPLEQQGHRKDLLPNHSDTTSTENAPIDA